MTTYTVLVKFSDGTEMEIKNASGYSLRVEDRFISVEVNKYRQFFNMDSVMFIGRKYDLRGEN